MTNFERLEKLLSQCLDVYFSIFKHIKYLWNGKLALICLKTAGHRRTPLQRPQDTQTNLADQIFLYIASTSDTENVKKRKL